MCAPDYCISMFGKVAATLQKVADQQKIYVLNIFMKLSML